MEQSGVFQLEVSEIHCAAHAVQIVLHAILLLLIY